MASNLSATILFVWVLLTNLSMHATINGYVINSEKAIEGMKISKMDVVTACQISCLDKFLFSGNEINPFTGVIDQCIERSECNMCIDFCEILDEESRMIGKLMCTNDSCVSNLDFCREIISER